MRSLLWIAIALVVNWLIAKVVAGVAGALLNLLWIAAIIFGIIWLIGHFTGRGRTRV